LAEEFNEKYARKSNAQLYFIGIIEELGKLAGIIKVKEFYQTPPKFYRTKPKGNLENQLVDFLYDVLMIASIYDIDLEKVFIDRMQQFSKNFLQK